MYCFDEAVNVHESVNTFDIGPTTCGPDPDRDVLSPS